MSFVSYFDSPGVREVSVVAASSKSYIWGFFCGCQNENLSDMKTLWFMSSQPLSQKLEFMRRWNYFLRLRSTAKGPLPSLTRKHSRGLVWHFCCRRLKASLSEQADTDNQSWVRKCNVGQENTIFLEQQQPLCLCSEIQGIKFKKKVVSFWKMYSPPWSNS